MDDCSRVSEITSNYERLNNRRANFYFRSGTLVGLALALD